MMNKKLIVGAAVGIGALLAFLFVRKAEAAGYVCPVCAAEFATLEELREHFEAEHPHEPIDIIWE